MDLFRWRALLLSPDGPPPATRAVLLVLSTFGDEEGEDIFPSTRRLAEASGWSRKTVEAHLAMGEAMGWIERTPIGSGQGWKRTRYVLRIPAEGGERATPHRGRGTPKVANGLRHAGEEGGVNGAERGVIDGPNVANELRHAGEEGGVNGAGRGVIDGPNVANELRTTSSVTSPETSPGEESVLSLRDDAPSPRVRDLVAAMGDGDVERLVELLHLPGLDAMEARWILEVTDLPDQEPGRLLSVQGERGWHADLVAASLRDLARKGLAWSRETWLTYLLAAVRVRLEWTRDSGHSLPQLAAGLLWPESERWQDATSMADVLDRLSFPCSRRSTPRFDGMRPRIDALEARS